MFSVSPAFMNTAYDSNLLRTLYKFYLLFTSQNYIQLFPERFNTFLPDCLTILQDVSSYIVTIMFYDIIL